MYTTRVHNICIMNSTKYLTKKMCIFTTGCQNVHTKLLNTKGRKSPNKLPYIKASPKGNNYYCFEMNWSNISVFSINGWWSQILEFILITSITLTICNWWNLIQTHCHLVIIITFTFLIIIYLPTMRLLSKAILWDTYVH